jgi:hypothetical protein
MRKGAEMPTLLVVYNAKDLKTADAYEQYLKRKKVNLLRSKPYIDFYESYRIDKVLAPSVLNPKNPPSEPPYQFVARCEINDLEQFIKDAQTPEMMAFAEEYSSYIDPNGPLNVFTLGHRVEP